MFWEVTKIISAMFIAFLAVVAFLRLMTVILSGERRRCCGKCTYYDGQMDCCWKHWRKVKVSHKCGEFRRGRHTV